MSSKIPVAFCFDEAYLRFAAVATGSLIVSRRTDVKVYWCVPATAVSRAEALLSQSIIAHLVEVHVVPLMPGATASWKGRDHIPPAAYLRLQLPDAIPERRVIYLDCDTIVTGPLDELYSMDLGASLLAGVADPVGSQHSMMTSHLSDSYINSGVLLLDLDRLRQDQFLARCVDIYHHYEAQVSWADQCVINKYAEGRKLVLPEKWNRQVFSQLISEGDFAALAGAPQSSVLHFVGHVKPWLDICPRFVAEFWWSHAERFGSGR